MALSLMRIIELMLVTISPRVVRLSVHDSSRFTSLPLNVAQLWVSMRGLAGPTLPALVGLDMLGEVIATHEPLATLCAAESLLAGVCAQVPLKLVRTCEALTAEEPVANERPLTCMPAQVRF